MISIKARLKSAVKTMSFREAIIHLRIRIRVEFHFLGTFLGISRIDRVHLRVDFQINGRTSQRYSRMQEKDTTQWTSLKFPNNANTH